MPLALRWLVRIFLCAKPWERLNLNQPHIEKVSVDVVDDMH